MIATALALLLALQDDAARAKQLLEEAAAALRKSRSLLIEMESKLQTGGDEGPSTTTRRRISIRLPNLYRQERRQGDSEYLSISDGKTSWHLDLKKLEYLEYPARHPDFSDALPAALFFAVSPGVILGSDVKVAPHKDGHAITWIERGRGAHLNKCWLWLSKDRVPLGYSVEGQRDGKATFEREDQFTRIDLDPKLADDVFTFVPPAGAKMAAPFKAERPPAEEVPKTKEAKAAIEILAKSAEALKAGVGLAYKVEFKSTGPSERSWKGRVAALRPDRYRVDTELNVVVCDGKACWYYFSSENNYTRYQPIQMPYDVAEKILGLYLDPEPGAAIKGAEVVELAHDKGFHAVTWVPERSPSTRYKLKIDATTHLPLEYSHETSRDDDVYRLVCTYSGFELSKAPAAEEFTFTPPAGSSEKTRAQFDLEGALLALGTPAPPLSGKGPGGKDVALADFKGKPILLAFGGAALKELKWLQSVQETFGGRGLEVVAVHWDDASKAMARRFESEKFTFVALGLPSAFTPGGPFGVRSHGTLYVIGKDGKVAARMIKHEVYQYTDAKLFVELDKALRAK